MYRKWPQQDGLLVKCQESAHGGMAPTRGPAVGAEKKQWTS